jgi:hypothetical protein
MLIYLLTLSLLSSLDSIIGSLICAIYSLGELYCLVAGHLFIDTYRSVRYRPRLVETYTGDIA